MRAGILCVLCLFLVAGVGLCSDAPPDDGDIVERYLAADKELRALRKELFELLAAQERLIETRDQLQLTAAATLSEGRATVVDRVGSDSLRSAYGVLEAASEMAAEVAEFQLLLDSVLDELPVEKVEAVKLRYRMDELAAKAERLRVLSAAPGDDGVPAGKCRVLAVNKDLGVAVIGAGTARGVRPGLVWYSADGAKARVLAARPYISAVAPIAGGLEGLRPGMVLTTAAPKSGLEENEVEH